MDKDIKDQYILIEQVKLLARQVPSMIWLSMLTTLVISLVLLGNVANWIPLSLIIAMITLSTVRLWHHGRLKHVIITANNVDFHSASFVFFSLIAGMIWGTFGLIFPIASDALLLVLTATLLGGLVAGAVPFLATYKKAYYAYSIPCITPFAIRCILSQHEMLVAIGILMLLLLVVNLFISHLAEKNVLRGIRLVRENRELIERLKDEKDNADDNNEAKSRFLAAASHDLRQPLHAMGFFVAALQHEEDPARVQYLTGKIAQTSEVLRSLMGSLLDISKIESGAMVPNRSHFNLGDILMEITQEFAEQAREKCLNLDYEPCLQTVYSDREMLGRIIRNLVSNAVRYTDQGYVYLSCDMAGGQVIIHVSDSGIGIAEGRKSDIFKEFFQINDGADQLSPGLGLGLSIVRGLCDLLGHDIDLASERTGGTVFSLTVPLGDLNRVTPETPARHILPGDVAAKTIIVNNGVASLESISGIMRHWGHVVADFTSCAEVMEFLDSEDFIPDLVISDITLKDACGVATIDAIQEKISRKKPGIMKIPGIIMTGTGGGVPSDAVKAAGFSLLQKPVQPAKLRSMVSYLVQGR